MASASPDHLLAGQELERASCRSYGLFEGIRSPGLDLVDLDQGELIITLLAHVDYLEISESDV